MTTFVGVDGCKAGWISVARCGGKLEPGIFSCIADLVAHYPDAERILIDIPIGLPWRDHPIRECDRLARRLLGRQRQSSVFAVPSRPATLAPDLDEARARNLSELGRSLTAQTWGIIAKVAEVDRFLIESSLRHPIREVHPEVCLWALNGRRPMSFSKKTRQGIQERISVLVAHEPRIVELLSHELVTENRRLVATDDVLDACVAMVTAEARVGQPIALAGQPAHDLAGLPMEMIFLNIQTS